LLPFAVAETEVDVFHTFPNILQDVEIQNALNENLLRDANCFELTEERNKKEVFLIAVLNFRVTISVSQSVSQ
jgi:hypothetical protein